MKSTQLLSIDLSQALHSKPQHANMTATRSGNEAAAADDAQVGSKHKTDGGASPEAKKAKKSDEKEQLTLEESFQTERYQCAGNCFFTDVQRA